MNSLKSNIPLRLLKRGGSEVKNIAIIPFIFRISISNILALSDDSKTVQSDTNISFYIGLWRWWKCLRSFDFQRKEFSLIEYTKILTK